VDWMAITKKDFDDFRCSRAGLHATERDDTIAPATMPVIISKSPPSTVSVTTSKNSSSTVSVTSSKSSSSTVSVTTSGSSPAAVSITTSKSSSSTASVTTSKSSSESGKDQDVLVYSNGKAALDHVLFDVLCQPWFGPLAEALERSRFNKVQDILLMHQAERDTLTVLNANRVVTPLLQTYKNMLLHIKLFSAYCERNGRPIVDWTKVTKADFNSILLYMEEEKVTIPPFSMVRHAIATTPRNVTSTAMVTLPPPMINFMSANPDIKVTNDPYIEAVDSPHIKQTPPKSPAYDFAPVEQQDTLHNFLHYVDQGTFSIPCEGKIFALPLAWTLLLGLGRSLLTC